MPGTILIAGDRARRENEMVALMDLIAQRRDRQYKCTNVYIMFYQVVL